MDDDQVWPTVPDEDLWIFDKLILSRKLGYTCGPVGVNVPKPGYYCVRPCVNLMGMGKGSSIEYISCETIYYPAGYFWQERFDGRHLSMDYVNGELEYCVEGFKAGNTTSKFHRWVLVDPPSSFELPPIVQDIVDRYPTVNVETIGNNIIEVHLRGNPDFADGCLECIPIWEGEWFAAPPEGFVFVEARDDKRIGFYKRY